MPNISEVEKLALDLPEDHRAILAAHLLDSLSPVLDDEDEGLAEARLRDADFDSDATVGISLQQLDEHVERRRS
ncbi:MAG: addiction module protein [Pyrinomonadaceae bacterium]